MQVAIFGAGSIGSTFAYQFARAGHDVTVIARGKRLEELSREGAIVLVTGERAEVTAKGELDATTPWDLVLVTVRPAQLAAVLPALAACSAKTIMFMFNTFEPLEPLRELVSADRFAFGFPGIVATLPEGKLKREILTRGQLTTVGDARWAKIFGEIGIPTVVHEDMHGWLRSHAAFIVPMMAAAAYVARRDLAGITWAEARACARAMHEGYRLVRALGHELTPSNVVALSRIPTFVVTFVIWTLSRTQMMRDLSAAGPGEARTLIDMMIATAPEKTRALAAIRP
jgi:2-dehydropantoate 2-reductase